MASPKPMGAFLHRFPATLALLLVLGCRAQSGTAYGPIHASATSPAARSRAAEHAFAPRTATTKANQRDSGWAAEPSAFVRVEPVETFHVRKMPKLDAQQAVWIFARLCTRFGAADPHRRDAEYFLKHQATGVVISVRFGSLYTIGMSYGVLLRDPRAPELPPEFHEVTALLEQELRATRPGSCAVTYWDEQEGVIRAGCRDGVLFSGKPPLLDTVDWLDQTDSFRNDHLTEWYILLEWLEAGRPSNLPTGLRDRLVFEVEKQIDFAIQHRTPTDGEWCTRMKQSSQALPVRDAQRAKLAQICRGK